MNNKQTAGFTLIEVMAVVTIIGILSAIAYPMYTGSIQKSRRADAKGALTAFAGAMERRFTAANNYCDVADATAGSAAVANCGTATNDTGAPTIFATTSPVDGPARYYDLTISAVSPTTFTLSATPALQQASDACGTLTLTNTGVRGVSQSTVANCW
jgi:type IV pilus assembly protein PilE